jgi:PAS domain S-box-containing protein
MGDARFDPHYARVRDAREPARELRAMSDGEVIAALGGASRACDPYLANVLATEALNRVQRQSAIMAHLGEGVIALDLAMRVAYANPAAERLLGWDQGGLLSRPVHESVHACGNALRCPFLGAIDAATGTPAMHDQFRRADGSFLPVGYVVTPIEALEERVGTVFIFWDGTGQQRLRESEERYRMLVELSPEPIAVHVAGTLAYLNPAGAKLLGAGDAGALLGRPVLDFVHPSSRALVADRMRLLATGQRALPLERERLQRLDGSTFEAEVRAWSIVFEGRPAVQLALRELTAAGAVPPRADS